MLYEIAEQNAIFNGEPDFMPVGMVINALNHNSFGGTKKDFKKIKNIPNLKRYKVTVKVEYWEIESE